MDRSSMIRLDTGITPAVALINPKYPHNGAAIRAASCFGARQVWWTGDRVSIDGESRKGRRLPREERMKGYQSVEMIHGDYLFDAFGKGTVPVAVELHAGSQVVRTSGRRPLRVRTGRRRPDQSGTPALSHGGSHPVPALPQPVISGLCHLVRPARETGGGRVGGTEDRGFIEPDSMAGVL